MALLSQNGGCPIRNSYIRMPNAHQSTAFPWPLALVRLLKVCAAFEGHTPVFLIVSGAKYSFGFPLVRFIEFEAHRHVPVYHRGSMFALGMVLTALETNCAILELTAVELFSKAEIDELEVAVGIDENILRL